MGLITVKNVQRKFNDNVVLNGLNLEINEGEFLGILGVSGCGKTTLLNLIAGALMPTKGEIFFEGKNIRYKKNILKKIGFATQEGSFFPQFTVEENLVYFGKLHNMEIGEIKKRVAELLEMLELKNFKDMKAKSLSKGMQRRLEMACALIHNPKVLLLDEPTGDLDPALRRKILNSLKLYAKEKNITIVLTSQLIDEAGVICERVAILDKGKIRDLGSVEELRKKYCDYDIIRMKTASQKYSKYVNKLKKQKNIKKVLIKNGRLVVVCTDKNKIFDKLFKILRKSKDKLLDLEVTKLTLSKLFEGLTKF